MAKNAMTGNIKVLGAILIVILFFAACKQPIDKSVERISIKLTMGNGSPFQIGYLTDSVMGEVTSISSLTISRRQYLPIGSGKSQRKNSEYTLPGAKKGKCTSFR
jgi:hypothetical protein